MRYGCLLLFVFSRLGWPQTEASHWTFAGPLGALLAPGTEVAPVSKGMPFEIVLSEQGAKISPSQFDLKKSNWSGPATLSFPDLKFANGVLTGSAYLKNGSGSVLEGLRLDLGGGAPLLLEDLGKGETAGPFPIFVGALSFTPGNKSLRVKGLLSGLYLRGEYAIYKGAAGGKEIDIDAQGRVYVCAAGFISRSAADMSKPTAFVEKEDACNGVAVDPRSQEVLANSGGNRIIRYSPDGRELGQIKSDTGDIAALTFGLRIDADGRIYNSGDNQRVIQVISGNRRIGVVPFESEGLFDVDANRNLYACLRDSVEVFDPSGNKLRTLATGNDDWHLGRVMNPVSVRVSPGGEIFAAERGTKQEAERISVFDNTGRFVRVFGRGGKGFIPDVTQPGQAAHVSDIAFGKGGAVYVLRNHVKPVLVFEPL